MGLMTVFMMEVWVEEKTSAHVLCECEALTASDIRNWISFFLDTEDIRSLRLRAIWNFMKEQYIHDLDVI